MGRPFAHLEAACYPEPMAYPRSHRADGLGVWDLGAARPPRRRSGARSSSARAGRRFGLVSEDGRCPDVEIDGASPGQTAAARALDAAFPVADLPTGAVRPRREACAPRRATRPCRCRMAQPRRIVVIGDTGCRIKGRIIQDCDNPRLWPFATIARKAAAMKPDLVIHVGDYYYRETPVPGGACPECAGSPYGDKWATWKAEFFDPARPLLAIAPFVFARGNHESCSRGGAGWFRLLDAGPVPLACPTAAAPFRVDLGDLSLYLVDSADTEDATAPPAAVAVFAGQLDALSADLAHRPGWIVTHRPIWGLAPVARLGPVGPLDIPLNATEQAAVRGHDLSAVRMIVSGHVHHFASFDFGPGRPSQLIAGTGGDIPEGADTPKIREQTPTIDGMQAHGISFDRFGYLVLDRTGADWSGVFRDFDDRVVATCRLHGRDLTCHGSGAR